MRTVRTIRETAAVYYDAGDTPNLSLPCRTATERAYARGYAAALKVAATEIPAGDLMGHPEAVVRYITLRYSRESQEVMGALYVDVRNRLVSEKFLYLGTLSRAAVEPRAIFEHAITCRAAGFLLFHNHPSGDPTPSAEDLVFTRRLADAGEVMGVRLLDHVVVGSVGRWVSLRRQGGW